MPATTLPQTGRRWARLALWAATTCLAARLNAEAAATPTPPSVWQISYRRDADLAVPEPLAAWWRNAIAREALRWRPLSGASVDASAWTATVRAASLTISNQHRADRNGELGEISGWCQGALTPAGAAATLGAWPGRVIAAISDGIAITDPDLRADLGEPPPGWRIHLDRATACALARNELNAPDLGAEFDVLALLFPDGLTIRLSEAHAAHWSFGGAQLVRRLDPRRLALLPDGLSAAFAIGVDGGGLGATFDRLRAAHTIEEGDEQKRGLDQVARLLRAIDGTVLLGMSADGDTVINLPRSSALDSALVALVPALSTVADGEAQEVGAPDVLRTHDSWIFAMKLEALEPWRAPARAAELPGSADAWCAGLVAADQLAHLTQAYALQLPDITGEAQALAQNEDNDSVGDPAMGSLGAALCMGRTLSQPLATIAAIARGVRDAGPAHVVGAVEHGQLRLDVAGAVAAWLPLAIALREARNALFYDCGMRCLGAALDRQRLLGHGPATADPSRAHLLPRWRSGHDLRRRLGGAQPLMPVPEGGSAWSEYAAHGSIVAAADQASSLCAQADGILAATAVLEDPQLPTLASLSMQEAGGAVVGPDGAPETLATDLQRLFPMLLYAGASLVVQGDIRGLTLIARADRSLDSALRSGMAMPMGAHGRAYDQAVFAACELGLMPAAEARSALDHRVAPIDASSAVAWPGLLELATNTWKPDPRPVLDATPGDTNHAFFSLPCDLASVIAAHGGAHGGIPVLVGDGLFQLGLPVLPPSPLADAIPRLEHRLITRAFALMVLARDGRLPTDDAALAEARPEAADAGHRTADGARALPALPRWRAPADRARAFALMLLARDGRLPADDAALAAATGPLTQAIGPLTVRVRYLRYPDGGFLLEHEIDDDLELGSEAALDADAAAR